MSNMATLFFFELKRHFADFKIFQPLVIFELNKLDFEAVGLDYIEEGSLVFLGQGKKSNQVNKIINKVY